MGLRVPVSPTQGYNTGGFCARQLKKIRVGVDELDHVRL
jgi:hypothetical protein